MISLQYLHIFSRLFPTCSMEEAVVAYWIHSIAQSGGEVVMCEGRRYVVVTAAMIREGIGTFRGSSERTARRILKRLTESGALDRVSAGKAGSKFAYCPTERFMTAIQGTPA